MSVEKNKVELLFELLGESSTLFLLLLLYNSIYMILLLFILFLQIVK